MNRHLDWFEKKDGAPDYSEARFDSSETPRFLPPRYANARVGPLTLLPVLLVLMWWLWAAAGPQAPAQDKTVVNKEQSWRPEDLATLEETVLAHTNRERATKGLAPLNMSPALRLVARTHTRNMCSTKSFKHESDEFPEGWRLFGERLEVAGVRSGSENIAYRTIVGTTETWAKAVVSGWMNSPGHKKNILNPEYRYLGVGVEGCHNTTGYATQVFSAEPGEVSGLKNR